MENASRSPSEISPQKLSFLLSGKLLLRQEIPFDEETVQQLLSENLLTKTASIIKKTFRSICQRCGNEKASLFAMIPCYRCKRTHLYCRKCMEMGRVMECEPLFFWSGQEPFWPKLENACSWQGKLTTAQQSAANRMKQAIVNSEKEILTWAVCGAGKTEMLFSGITAAFEEGKRVCLATPRADVVRELLPRLKQAFQAVTIEALYGGSEDKAGTAQLIIATTHQLLRYKAAFDVLIIDEIDAFPFHADPSLPYAANRARKQQGTTIYLTATPRETHQKQIASNKLPHVFVPIRFHGYPLPVPKLEMCFSLKKDLQKCNLPKPFINWIKKRKNPTRQLLIFLPTVELTEQLEGNITAALLKEELLTSSRQLTSVHASDPARADKVQHFRNKELFVLVTTTILERGVTFPSVDVAIINAGHDVFDEAALVQISGRAGRSPDDPEGEVIFFHDGKTEAMVQAIDGIKKMNRRGGFN